jgi:biopolymer transport protein ExbD
MAQSRRAQRMDRHHRRNRGGGTISLVSMMDIFTILVFFLLVNSTDVEVLPSAKNIKLPESTAELAPHETIVITVSDRDLLVQGRRVASLADIERSGGDLIPPLKSELDHQAARSGAKAKRELTIMGDKQIPYRLLKRIMLTGAAADYETISLAVLRKEGGEG